MSVIDWSIIAVYLAWVIPYLRSDKRPDGEGQHAPRVDLKVCIGLLAFAGVMAAFVSEWFISALTPAILLEAEHSGSLAALRRLRREYCRVEAWLRFARAPLLDDAGAIDLRFGPDANFSTLTRAQWSQPGCPADLPRWEFPRRDLLTPPPLAEAR